MKKIKSYNKTKFKLIAIVLTLVFFCGLLEIFSHILIKKKPYYFFKNPSTKSQFIFLKNYKLQNKLNSVLFDNHSTIGWVLKPSTKVFFKDLKVTYSSNQYGARDIVSKNENIFNNGKKNILIFGDSFSFGTNLNFKDTWVNKCQELLPKYNFVNFSVPGFGTDQMYLRAKEILEKHKPDLLIFPFIKDNLERTLFDFRYYQKPKFIIKDENLELTSVPIRNPDENIKNFRNKLLEMKSKKILSPSLLSAIYSRLIFKIKRSKNSRLINDKIFSEVINLCKNKCQVLFISLACCENINDKNTDDFGEEFLKSFQDNNKNENVHFYFTRQDFNNQSDKTWTTDHYSVKESQFISKKIIKKIKSVLN